MAKNPISRFTIDDKEVILVGTAHVSQDSVDLVKQVIEEEKPDSVCIELDEQRFETIQNPKAWESTDIVQVIKKKQAGFMLATLALSSYQRKMAKKLDTQVGGEMLQGIQSAKEVGAELVLADRNIQTTFLRIWRKINLWEKCKLISSLFFSFDEEDDLSEASLQDLMQEDMLESVLSDMRKSFPKIGDILIGERDQYLAYKIRNAPGKKVVAILGGAHVPGVSKELYRDIDMEEISTLPPKKKTLSIIGWLIPLAIVGLFVYAFTMSAQSGFEQLSTWAIWNSSFAALFTLLVLGHPLSILTSFLLAPFSALNPLVAVGWISGLVQAYVQKPTVKDLTSVHDDILSFKGLFRNKVIKVLLVVVFANIGSTIGTVIGGAGLIRNLF